MKKTIFIILCAILVLSVSCNSEQKPQTGSTEPIVKDGCPVTKEQWERAFSTNSTIDEDLGFESVTVSVVTPGYKQPTILAGNGWMISEAEAYFAQLLMLYHNEQWFYKFDKNNWEEYDNYESVVSNVLSNENVSGLININESFDAVHCLGSKASLAYICRERNFCFGSDANLKECYNEEFFDESDGSYKFKLVIDYENGHIMRPVPLSETEGRFYYDLVTIRFNSNAMLTSIEGIATDGGGVDKWTFYNYNSTVKPSDLKIE